MRLCASSTTSDRTLRSLAPAWRVTGGRHGDSRGAHANSTLRHTQDSNGGPVQLTGRARNGHPRGRTRGVARPISCCVGPPTPPTSPYDSAQRLQRVATHARPDHARQCIIPKVQRSGLLHVRRAVSRALSRERPRFCSLPGSGKEIARHARADARSGLGPPPNRGADATPAGGAAHAPIGAPRVELLHRSLQHASSVPSAAVLPQRIGRMPHACLPRTGCCLGASCPAVFCAACKIR